MRAGQACSVVHSENAYASGHKKRPRGPRSAPLVELTGSLDVIPQHPLVDLKTQAIMYYLQYHLQRPNDAPKISQGVHDDFRLVWMSGAKSPILDLALSSMALAVFSRTKQHPRAAIEGSVKYQQLLHVAHATIVSLDEGNVDACLLAIFFMSRYEDTVHRPGPPDPKIPFTTTLQSFSHHNGALAILKIWKERLSHIQSATDVIKHTRRGLIRSALLRTVAVPKWMQDGASFGEHGLELEYDGIIVRFANLRHRFSILLKENTGLRRLSHEFFLTVEELNKETRDIDNALQTWSAHFPRTWSYNRHTLPNPHHHPWPTRDFYSPLVHSYANPAYAAVWNQYFSTRMLVLGTRLRGLTLTHPNPDHCASEQRAECLSRMKTMANDLASSIPFCLQRFKTSDNSADSSSPPSTHSITLNDTTEEINPYLANLAVWPLGIASSLADVNVEQRFWFRSQLARLGRVIGVGVLECAETERWLEL